MKYMRYILLYAICILLLLGCGNTKTGHSTPEATDSAQTLATHPRQEGAYYLSDLVDIIPGHTTYDEIYAMGLDYKFYIDSDHMKLFVPTENGNYYLIWIKVPEEIVSSVSFYSNSSHFSGKRVETELDFLLTIDDFRYIVPGKSTYQDIYDICGLDYGEFPQMTGMKLVVPVYHDNEVEIEIAWDGTVSSISHLSTPGSFEYPDHVIPRYNLGELFKLTPGKSTYEDLKLITHDDGTYFNSPPNSLLILPAEYGNVIVITMRSETIESIVLGDPHKLGFSVEEPVVNLPNSVTVSDFSKLIPTQSECEDVSEICRQDLREYIEESGLCVVIPFAYNTQLTIDMDAEGIVTAVSYRLAPNEEQKTD